MELKACPFCGSEYVKVFCLPGIKFVVGCENDECGCQTPQCDYHTQAIELWNRRANDGA